MEIKPVEIRNLLLNLVDALTPLAKEQPRDTRFLAKRIFQSSSKEMPLLETLYTAQKQMIKWIPSNIKAAAEPPQVSLSSIAVQARYLLAQVRGVINTLATSSRLGKLEEGVLDDQIERLKLSVEKLIEAVERKGMEFSGDQRASDRPLPPSPREHLFRKAIPLPSTSAPHLPEKKLFSKLLKKKKKKRSDDDEDSRSS